MPLVDYSSDSSSDTPERTRKRKRSQSPVQGNSSKLPPLPSSFRDLYATPVRTSTVDDPTLHGGRQRLTPHVAGKWPTHVYTEWYPSKGEAEALDNLVDLHRPSSAPKKAADGSDGTPPEIHSFLRSDLGAIAPLHISLSRSLSLDTAEREVFEQSLRTAIETTGIDSFYVSASSLRWVPNYTRSRWFLVLNLHRPKQDELNRLLAACNQVATSYGYPGLYTGSAELRVDAKGLVAPPAPGEAGDMPDGETLDIDPTALELTSASTDDVIGSLTKSDPFHISIAWTLSDPAHWASATNADKAATDGDLGKLRVPVNAIKAKVGNTIHHISLEKDRREVEKRTARRWMGA